MPFFPNDLTHRSCLQRKTCFRLPSCCASRPRRRLRVEVGACLKTANPRIYVSTGSYLHGTANGAGKTQIFSILCNHGIYRSLFWRDFQRQMTSVVGQQGWPRWSCCAEISLKRKHSANLLHFHLAVSDPGRNHRLGRLAAWAFQGSTPVPKGTNGRGRHLIRALDGAHYYTQAPKRGRVYQACNYAAFTDFPVEMNTIFGLRGLVGIGLSCAGNSVLCFADV